MKLKQYQSMRDFSQTPEPRGKRVKRGKASHFLIQKHAARRLHYDFRLEADGVLVSWAVPKGLPTRHGDRRLAVHVEDHPLDYADFEGVIPAGNYGGGTVMLWDRGTYQVEGDFAQQMKQGKLDLTLDGEKLHGAWTLVRTRGLSGKDPWLVIKGEDSIRAITKKDEDRSVISGRKMAEIAAQRDAVWESGKGRKETKALPKKKSPVTAPDKLPKAAPAYHEPMKAKLVDELPAGKDWVYEIKFDGVRALAVRKGSKVQLYSRNHIDRALRYPEIAAAIGDLPCQSAVLDGEVVALDSKGRSSFQLLQESLDESSQTRPPIYCYLFDLLQLDGKDLKSLPLIQRKQILESLLEGAPEALRYSAHVEGKTQKIVQQVRKLLLEGIIAKRGQSHYEVGRRSGAWVKLKIHQSQEFVIGGYTAPRGSRDHFGALLVGYFEKGKLLYASKVGTGFDATLLKSLFRRFQILKTATCPFANLPQKNTRRGALTAAMMRDCVWLRPKLVAQVKFQEWTREGGLRQPVFLGLRDDKKPSEIRREMPKPR